MLKAQLRIFGRKHSPPPVNTQFILFHRKKTEYEIETIETMKTEQKAIVLGTKEYIKYCNLDKRLLCWPKWSKNALKLESKFL